MCCSKLIFNNATREHKLPTWVQNALLYNLNVWPLRPVVDMLKTCYVQQIRNPRQFTNPNYINTQTSFLKRSTSRSLISGHWTNHEIVFAVQDLLENLFIYVYFKVLKHILLIRKSNFLALQNMCFITAVHSFSWTERPRPNGVLLNTF